MAAEHIVRGNPAYNAGTVGWMDCLLHSLFFTPYLMLKRLLFVLVLKRLLVETSGGAVAAL